MITLADIIMTTHKGEDLPILALPEILPSHDGLQLELCNDGILRLSDKDGTKMAEIDGVDHSVMELLAGFMNIPVLEAPPHIKTLPEKLSLMADIEDRRS